MQVYLFRSNLEDVAILEGIWVDLDLISNLQDILSWDNNKSYLFSISNSEGFSDIILTISLHVHTYNKFNHTYNKFTRSECWLLD